MSATEPERPRAQYGEYATPEQQQRARGLEGNDWIASGTAAIVPVGRTGETRRPTSSTAAHRVAEHPVDRIVTIVLLAFGMFLLLNSIPGYLAMPQTMQTVFDQLDAGTYAAPDVAASLGMTALVLQSVIWIATAASAWLALRRGRLAWWLVLLGGVLSFLAMMVIVSVALFADPGFVDSLSR